MIASRYAGVAWGLSRTTPEVRFWWVGEVFPGHRQSGCRRVTVTLAK